MRLFLTVFIILILLHQGWAQSTNVPLNPDYYHLIQRYEIKEGEFFRDFYNIVKPYTRESVAAFADTLIKSGNYTNPVDRFNLFYLANDNWEWSEKHQNESRNPIFKHFYRVKSDFFHVDTDEFDLHVNPVLYLGLGFQGDDDAQQYINTRGVEIRGMVNRKLGFYSFIGENQAVFPRYVRNEIARNGVIPGEGFWKDFKENGVDFFTARGYISFNPIEQINFQFGHDRIFLGNGIRSAFLSDFSNNYLFLKLNTRVWKINYTNLFANLKADVFSSGTGSNLGPYPDKYLAMHHLSIDITKNLNIGFFESVVQGEPDSLRGGGFDLNYLNPVIFYRALEHQNGSADNAIVGMDVNWLPRANWMIYGQLLLDEFLLSHVMASDGWWANKWAFQVGFRHTDLFGIPNLDLQLETNRIRPFTYGHKDIYTNFAHYRQPLAHPLGANLQEYLADVHFQPLPRLTAGVKFIFTHYGEDTLSTNYGKNILLSYVDRELEFGNEIGQGIGTDLFFADFSLTYQLKHNLFLDLGQTFRRMNSDLDELSSSDVFTTLALRWNIPARRFYF
jgi:hypothetical protein